MTSSLEASVIIVVRNDPRIAKCLASVLEQDMPRDKYEIIVVDNCSGDETPLLVREFPVRLLSEENVGMCYARNHGISEAKGKIIVFTDSDCIVSSTWLSEILGNFTSESVGGVGGVVLKLDEAGEIALAARDLVVGQQRVPQYLPMFPLPYIVTANAAYRLSVLRQIGGFDPLFFSGGDVDVAWRVQAAGYELKWSGGAVVYHASRATFAAYFHQFYKYGLGHALLFKKFRSLTHQRFLVNAYPFQELAKLVLFRFPRLCLYTALGRGERLVWTRLILDLLEYIALFSGDVRGAIRFRVPYI